MGNADDIIRIQNTLTDQGINRARAILIKDIIRKDALTVIKRWQKGPSRPRLAIEHITSAAIPANQPFWINIRI